MQTETNRQTVEPSRELAVSNGATSVAPILKTDAWWNPKNLEQALEFAEVLATSGMVPKDYVGKKGAVLAAIIMGAEVGLSPMAALQNIASINGRPSIWGDAMPGVCMQHPLWESIEEKFVYDGKDAKEQPDTFRAVCIVRRKGNPKDFKGEFSIGDAKRANLWDKVGPWKSYPQRMLKMRARAFALRDAFPDALRGLHCAEESQDIPVEHEVTASAPLTGGAGLKQRLGVEEPRMPEQSAPAPQAEHGQIPPSESAPARDPGMEG